jgi:hypothetical protein
VGVFIPAVNCAKFEMRFTAAGQKVENVFHMKQAVPYDAATLAIDATNMIGWWVASLQNKVTNQVTLDSVVATALDAPTSPGIIETAGLPATGTNGGTMLPMNVTFAVRWLTALRGRSFTGRTFHIGTVLANVQGSLIEPVAKGVFTAAYANLIATMAGAGVGLAVVSYYHARAPRVSAVATFITSASIEGTLDSQRRRLPGRGQ